MFSFEWKFNAFHLASFSHFRFFAHPSGERSWVLALRGRHGEVCARDLCIFLLISLFFVLICSCSRPVPGSAFIPPRSAFIFEHFCTRSSPQLHSSLRFRRSTFSSKCTESFYSPCHIPCGSAPPFIYILQHNNGIRLMIAFVQTVSFVFDRY